MKVPDIIKQASRDLRKNMTGSEVILWKFLKDSKLGVNFLRQKPIHVFTEDSGMPRYIIADFYCHKKRLVIEIDGNIHEKREVYNLDRHKELLLMKLGFKIIRIKNDDIKNHLNQTIKYIQSYL